MTTEKQLDIKSRLRRKSAKLSDPDLLSGTSPPRSRARELEPTEHLVSATDRKSRRKSGTRQAEDKSKKRKTTLDPGKGEAPLEASENRKRLYQEVLHQFDSGASDLSDVQVSSSDSQEPSKMQRKKRKVLGGNQNTSGTMIAEQHIHQKSPRTTEEVAVDHAVVETGIKEAHIKNHSRKRPRQDCKKVPLNSEVIAVEHAVVETGNEEAHSGRLDGKRPRRSPTIVPVSEDAEHLPPQKGKGESSTEMTDERRPRQDLRKSPKREDVIEDPLVETVKGEPHTEKTDGKRPRRSLFGDMSKPSTTAVSQDSERPRLVHYGESIQDLQIQQSQCKSRLYQPFERCAPCLAKKGDPCRFLGLRAFFHKDGKPVDLPYFVSDKPVEDLRLPSALELSATLQLSDDTEYKLLLTYETFAECIKKELAHISAPDSLHCIKRPLPLTRQTCDICEQGIYNVYYLCTICGKDLCMSCIEECWGPPGAENGVKPSNGEAISRCTFRRTHSKRNFLCISRYDKAQIEASRDWVIKWMGTRGDIVRKRLTAQKENDLAILQERTANGATNAKQTENPNEEAVATSDIDRLINAPHPDLVIIPYDQLTVPLFQHFWRQRKVIFVTNMTDRLTGDWRPQAFAEVAGDDVAGIVDCKTGEMHPETELREFFGGFGKPGESGKRSIVKLKDWPTDMHFSAKLPEHSRHFLDIIPISEYTHPTGIFNLVRHIPENDVPPDLGPKMYAAYGYEPSETGGTTKLHLDVADAANVLVWGERHSSTPNGGPEDVTPPAHRIDGAMWDLFPPSSISKLRHYLRTSYYPPSTAAPPIDDPIHDQTFYLHPRHLSALATDHDVIPIRLHQGLGDTVFIPAGFAHQVANYGDCIKCALDFVSAEGIGVCEDLCGEFRKLMKGHGRKGDTVCVAKIAWGVVRSAMDECCNIREDV